MHDGLRGEIAGLGVQPFVRRGSIAWGIALSTGIIVGVKIRSAMPIYRPPLTLIGKLLGHHRFHMSPASPSP